MKEFEELVEKDPLAGEFLVAEYYFMKKEYDKAREMFAKLHQSEKLDVGLHNAARNYLILADRIIRSRTMDQAEFEIQFKYNEPNGQAYHYTINKTTFASKVNEIGMLLEVVDFYLKKQKKSEEVVSAGHKH